MNYALIVVHFCRKMPPRRSVTQESLKIPKGKGAQLGEASNPAPTKGVEQMPKIEPVIRVPLKKVFNQLPLYKDKEPSTGNKVLLPSWNELFIEIKNSDYP
jgi:hypothetical protein